MKLTIKQIKQAIDVNVTGTINVEKQQGTNLWYIQIKEYNKKTTPMELDELGLKIISINFENNIILAELDKNVLSETYYARQITIYN